MVGDGITTTLLDWAQVLDAAERFADERGDAVAAAAARWALRHKPEPLHNTDLHEPWVPGTGAKEPVAISIGGPTATLFEQYFVVRDVLRSVPAADEHHLVRAHDAARADLERAIATRARLIDELMAATRTRVGAVSPARRWSARWRRQHHTGPVPNDQELAVLTNALYAVPHHEGDIVTNARYAREPRAFVTAIVDQGARVATVMRLLDDYGMHQRFADATRAISRAWFRSHLQPTLRALARSHNHERAELVSVQATLIDDIVTRAGLAGTEAERMEYRALLGNQPADPVGASRWNRRAALVKAAADAAVIPSLTEAISHDQMSAARIADVATLFDVAGRVPVEGVTTALSEQLDASLTWEHAPSSGTREQPPGPGRAR